MDPCEIHPETVELDLRGGGGLNEPCPRGDYSLAGIYWLSVRICQERPKLGGLGRISDGQGILVVPPIEPSSDVKRGVAFKREQWVAKMQLIANVGNGCVETPKYRSVTINHP